MEDTSSPELVLSVPCDKRMFLYSLSSLFLVLAGGGVLLVSDWDYLSDKSLPMLQNVQDEEGSRKKVYMNSGIRAM